MVDLCREILVGQQFKRRYLDTDVAPNLLTRAPAVKPPGLQETATPYQRKPAHQPWLAERGIDAAAPIFSGPAPFAQLQWDAPRRKYLELSTDIDSTFIDNGPVTTPFSQTEWPNPFKKRAVPYGEFPANVLVRGINPPQVPFSQLEWPVTLRKKATPQSDFTASVLTRGIIGQRPPFVPIDMGMTIVRRYTQEFAHSPQLVSATDVSVPDVVGLTQAAGTLALIATGLAVSVTYEINAQAAGTILSQIPTAGSIVAVGSTVAIVVSLGIGILRCRAYRRGWFGGKIIEVGQYLTITSPYQYTPYWMIAAGTIPDSWSANFEVFSTQIDREILRAQTAAEIEAILALRPGPYRSR